MTNWTESVSRATNAMSIIDDAIADLTRFREKATADIAQYLRIDEGVDLDIDAIRATLTRPYTLLPINEHEAWLIHWRGVKMPIFGWVVAQEPAFIKARVTRSMDLLTPLPGWMKQELGWKPPEHKAVIDGTRTSLQLIEGDDASFKRKYGKHLGGKQADGSFKIRGGDSWIKLVAALVRDGILPYAPTPVASENWNNKTFFGVPELLQRIIEQKEKEAHSNYITRAVNEFKEKGAVLINYPPGSGKTLATCLILGHFKGRVLILADTTMLIDQWRDRLARFVGKERDITLSTYQGAGKYLNEEWDLMVFDECFPAGTLIDGRAIETLKVGDRITSFDEQMFEFTSRRITRVFKRPAPRHLLRIRVNGAQLVCTLDHPIFTGRGWVKARELTTEDQVLVYQEHSYGKQNHETNSTNLQLVRPAICYDRQEQGGLLEGMREGVLLNRALGSGKEPGFVDRILQSEHEASAQCFGSHEAQQSNAQEGCSRQGLCIVESDGLGSENSGWQWPGFDRTAAAPGRSIGMADRVHNLHWRKEPSISILLQSGYCKSPAYDRDRSGRSFSSSTGSPEAGSQEGTISRWARVDSVEIQECRSDEQLGSMCPDGYVYNLEVEPFHTYIANGIVVHNCQRLPANTFSRLAFIKTKYRLALSGTAWREDDRQHLIVALSGFPVAIRWSEMITAGVLKKPRIIVATVANDAAKISYVKSLVAKRRGRCLIFCDWIEQGKQLADALDVPFVHGATPHKLERIQESDVCVVSRIGDRGISLPDLRLVIEVAGAGSAREQFAQRVGRLLHGEFEGEFVTVFTPEEAAKYRGRVFGVEAELAGSVDIEFIDVTGKAGVTAVTAKPSRLARSPRVVNTTREPRPSTQPRDEISQTFAVPALMAKLNQAHKSVGNRTAPYIERVMRYCWSAALSPTEIAEGLGITDEATRSRLSSACKAAMKLNLMTVDADGRYQVNQAEIQRLKALSNLHNS
jgi:hypothetical protein